MTIESDDFGVGQAIPIDNPNSSSYTAEQVDVILARKASRTVIEELESRIRELEAQVANIISLLGGAG